jgi:hypothetical protein
VGVDTRDGDLVYAIGGCNVEGCTVEGEGGTVEGCTVEGGTVDGCDVEGCTVEGSDEDNSEDEVDDEGKEGDEGVIEVRGVGVSDRELGLVSVSDGCEALGLKPDVS